MYRGAQAQCGVKSGKLRTRRKHPFESSAWEAVGIGKPGALEPENSGMTLHAWLVRGMNDREDVQFDQ